MTRVQHHLSQESQMSGKSRLIVGDLPADFNPHIDVPIGAWCFANCEDVYPDWEQRFDVGDPVTDVASAKDADDCLAALANEMLIGLAEEMNTRHSVAYSSSYWHVLLMRWLLELLGQSYYRYLEAKRAVLRNIEQSLNADIYEHDHLWEFSKVLDLYQNGLRDEAYNNWLTGLALRELACDHVSIHEIPVPASKLQRVELGALHNSPPMIKRCFHMIKSGRAHFSGDIFEISISDRVRSVVAHAGMNVWLNVIPKKAHIERPNPESLDTSAARRLDREFIQMAQTVVRASIPKSFTDHFPMHHAQALQRRVKPGRVNLQVPAFFFSEPRLFKLARAIEAGEGLVFVQHGANYGMAHAYSLGAEIEYRHHAFFTWGWSRHDDYHGRFVPLPAPQLINWRNRYRENNGRLLFTSGEIYLMFVRIMSIGALFNVGWLRREKDTFFKKLVEPAFSMIDYRPYPQQKGSLSDWAYFSKRHERLNIVEDGFHDSLARCRLVVLDHPGLTFLAAMTAKIPTIGFWNTESWAFSMHARSHFDRFRSLGIIHDSGEAAASKVNAVWDHIEDWWCDPDIQESRDLFCQEFARTDRHWWWQWMKALVQV
ncbi:MAG: hypothetical protein CMF67_07165 [Magnetovibrio sp.]|nr:hypothetical protein [Magnetovibrio sp.]